MPRPRLTGRVLIGLKNCSTFLDVNLYEDSDLLQNIDVRAQADTERAIEWIDGMIRWYESKHPMEGPK